MAFMDECGDHSMERIDKDFPLFVLATVVMEREVYVKSLIPALAQFKLRYWNHEGINLHSRDIRKALGPFSLLMNPLVRSGFLNSITTIARETPFALFISGIRKDEHAEGCGKQTADPYDLALEFTMERVAHFLKGEMDTELPIIAEARGRREDNALERVFYRIMRTGLNLNQRTCSRICRVLWSFETSETI